jgi:DNA-binding MarR family transcriptional regulator
MQLLTERYSKKIQGVIACYDRVVIHGTLPGFNYAQGMASFLKARNIRIFDYPRFAQTHRDDIRTNAEAIAKEHEIGIQFIQKTHIRKDDIIKNIIKERGDHPGLVAILSAMESCQAYKPWHDKNTHQTYLRYTQGKCLHYYFYFIDKILGLCYLRVPTWCPFRLQFYYNGHSWLASELTKHGIGYSLIENGFVFIEDRTAGIKRLKKASHSIEANGHSYKGFNFFYEADVKSRRDNVSLRDLEILRSIARGEFNINGFQNKNLRKHLVQKTSSQVSRILKRLHLHGLIKKVRDTYKYYPTKLGRSVIATGLKLKELYIIPQLCY